MARSIPDCLYGGHWPCISQEEHATTVRVLAFFFCPSILTPIVVDRSPDKNPGVKGAQERFARLGVIGSILRSQEGRERSVSRVSSVPKLTRYS